MSKIVAVFIVIHIIGLAIFFGKIKEIITISIPNKNVNNLNNKSNIERRESTKMMGDGYQHLLIFLQVSI